MRHSPGEAEGPAHRTQDLPGRSGLTCTEAATRIDHPATTSKDVANRHAWMADAYRRAGKIGQAISHRNCERALLEAQLEPRSG